MLLFFIVLTLIILMNIDELYIRVYTLGLSLLLLSINLFFILRYIYYINVYEGLFFGNWNIVLDFFFFKMEMTLCYDGLSLILIFLTLILYVISLISIWSVTKYFRLLNLLLLSVIYLVILSFLTFDLFFFYVLFEAVLIPMFLIIGIWGSRDRKLTASFRFLFYTIIASVFFFSVIIYLYFVYGTTNLYQLLLFNNISNELQVIFWLFTFLAFAVKIPMYPLHTWLPEAHAEAPTVGSILLAGILLKLGPYGLLRFSNVLFPYGFFYFRPFLYLFCLLGLYYTGLTAIRQIDLKKIIAYSSIGHMALIVLGICTNTIEGLIGAIILLLAHGFVSGGLFLCVGFLYERYKTRIILYYGGLAQINPKLSVIMFLFLLGNIAFPLTLNFIAELLILIGLADLNTYLLVLVGLASIFVLAYNLYMFSRVFFGQPKLNLVYNKDLSIREVSGSLIFLFPVFFWGLFPTSLIKFFYDFVVYYLFVLYYI